MGESGEIHLRSRHLARGYLGATNGARFGRGIAATDPLPATRAADALVEVSTVHPADDLAMSDYAPHDRLAVHAFRRDELLTFEVALDRAPLDTAWLSLDATADDAVRARRRLWLGA